MAQARTTAGYAVKYLLGKCVPSSKQNAAKIRVKKLDFDSYLTMYFPKYDFIYASDPNGVCKTGDTVLIKNLPEKLTRLISYEVVKVVYPLGDIIDPITGKPVVVSKYREDIEATAQMFGKKESMFDYKSALPRGTQEDKRDFTHKESYLKHYDDPEKPQPYAIDP